MLSCSREMTKIKAYSDIILLVLISLLYKLINFFYERCDLSAGAYAGIITLKGERKKHTVQKKAWQVPPEDTITTHDQLKCSEKLN